MNEEDFTGNTADAPDVGKVMEYITPVALIFMIILTSAVFYHG